MLATEIRCPNGARKLLAKVMSEGNAPKIAEGNLMELHCRDCTRTARAYDPRVVRVVHRYNLMGQLVESEETRS